MSTDDAVERANAEHVMAAFAVVLTHPAGFGIELFADLWISRLEDGQFSVTRHADGLMTSEELFDDVREAISYYLDLRDDVQLGFDHERESST